ncbi:MAG: biotin/lipoate A/B protein ligase family protein [bacterium]|nr:biotin/lipoate A/B protein ligase family protein [bacterium]
MRLLITKECRAAYNMALDEAIFLYMGKNSIKIPTLRMYSWNPVAFSIGYFQRVEEVLNLKKCEDIGVDWVRRPSGGGAILHKKEVTYSFITEANNEFSNISTSYAKINRAILETLKLFNLNFKTACYKIDSNKHHLCFLEFAGIDILLNGKKVSGSAQRRRNGVVLHHGSIKLDIDVNLLKIISRTDEDEVLSKMTSLKRELGDNPGFDKVAEAITKSFEKVFEEEVIESVLMEEEIKIANELIESKYANEKWNYKRR